MVKLFEQTHIFEHSWQSVTQAIWNKYPNPWASHVLTADVIDRYVDPETGVLHTTRLFTKEGRLPKWSKSEIKDTKRVPVGGKDLGSLSLSEAYILEISELDPVKKTFKTVTRNLSHAKLMLVEETQIVSPYVAASSTTNSTGSGAAAATTNTTDPDVVTIPSSNSNSGTRTDSKPSGTAIHITARIISNTGWFAVRSRIEQFGASKIRENTMRSSIGLMHVIEDLKRRKLIV